MMASLIPRIDFVMELTRSATQDIPEDTALEEKEGSNATQGATS